MFNNTVLASFGSLVPILMLNSEHNIKMDNYLLVIPKLKTVSQQNSNQNFQKLPFFSLLSCSLITFLNQTIVSHMGHKISSSLILFYQYNSSLCTVCFLFPLFTFKSKLKLYLSSLVSKCPFFVFYLVAYFLITFLMSQTITHWELKKIALLSTSIYS